MAFSGYIGMLTPTDLQMVQRVFDQLCKERRLAQRDREQREDLAAELIRTFRQGATNEVDLWQRISKLRRAQTGVTQAAGTAGGC
ncbi:RNA-binding protein [Mesorhizobium sp. IMUNJ 23232]|uniref:RNA-binding protein n=1 Tax=Mesorhizobium sp. IMUNJ 23232 TaxID=3376064 RepID=UPI0037ACD895